MQNVIEDGLLKDFRGKRKSYHGNGRSFPTDLIIFAERRWLESMLTELTYISAVQQDPREIQNAPVSHTHEEKHKSYRWLRDDLERLLVTIHAREEWDTRNTFSELLELTQRSWQFGKQATHKASF